MPAQETYLSWSFDSVCILLQTVVCNLSPLFCVCSFEPCQLVDERICDGSDHGVPPVCQVLCEPLTFYKYSLFQTCEVGDCHHFTEEAVELRGQGAWLWSHRDQLLLQHFVIPGSQWLLHMSWYLATCSRLCSAHLVLAAHVLFWGLLEGATIYKACCSQGRAGQTLQGPEYNLTRGRGVAEEATYQTPSQWAGMSTSPSGKNGCQGREDGASTLS